MSVLEYKCPSCGSALIFDSTSQKMVCHSCSNSFEVDTIRQFSDNMQSTEAEDRFEWENISGAEQYFSESELSGVASYSCPSCGGEIIGEMTTAATSCPYCRNPAVIASQLSGLFKPDYIIPFQFKKEDSKEYFKKFLKGKMLLPKQFKKENDVENITGLYVPFWLFDCGSGGSVNFNATRSHSWSDSKYNYTRTDHYQIHRSGNVSFERIPVDGSIKMDDSFMEAIEPFDYTKIFEFRTEYLSGYLADKFDNDAENCKLRANERVKNSFQAILRSTVHGYESVTVQSSNINLNHGKMAYALFPVWMMNSNYKGKTYQFAMNGQTGKFVGELPISWGKFFAWAGGLTAGIGVVISAVYTLLNI